MKKPPTEGSTPAAGSSQRLPKVTKQLRAARLRLAEALGGAENRKRLQQTNEALRASNADRKRLKEIIASLRVERKRLQEAIKTQGIERKRLKDAAKTDRDLTKKLHATIATLRAEVEQATRLNSARGVPAPSKEAPPIAFIASGGSSGSHLLAHLLAGYRPFVAGDEPNLATRPDLFNPSHFRGEMLKGFMRADPIAETVTLSTGRIFHVVPPMLLTNEESYGWQTLDAKADLIAATPDWQTFILKMRDRLAALGIIPEDAILLEHSPSCAVSLKPFLESHNGSRAVHLVRDPRDAIASMTARRPEAPFFKGIQPEENLRITAIQWCVLTEAALSAETSVGYLRVRYEDLVTEPTPTLRSVHAHLTGCDPAVQAETWDGSAALLSTVTKQAGWKNSPSGPISTSSIGRHRDFFSPDDLDRLVNMRYASPRLSFEGRVGDLIERLGYSATAA
jgi:hypothetical protein